MSRRGAGSVARTETKLELVPAPELARRVVRLARELLGEGLDAGEVCSLFTDAAQILSKQRGGFSRDEWRELCDVLYERDEEIAEAPRLTAPGGSA